ncbi:50S ribosomal protein L29 [Candidatus Uhrbacteria bacterium]|nr:50S ribosomal protein L29 [Candidatus Uhrbacteria bacterium]
MDTPTIRSKSDAELRSILTEQQALLEDLRFRASARELKNVHEIRACRRVIARILTVLSERQSASGPEDLKARRAVAATA